MSERPSKAGVLLQTLWSGARVFESSCRRSLQLQMEHADSRYPRPQEVGSWHDLPDSDWNQRLLDPVSAFEPGMKKLKIKRGDMNKFTTSRPIGSGPENTGPNRNLILQLR